MKHVPDTVGRSRKLIGVAGFALVALVLLFKPPIQLRTTSQELTVQGRAEALRQFIGTQHARRPALQIRSSAQQASIDLPKDFTSKQPLALTDEALAAGLSYSYTRREAKGRITFFS